MWLTFISWLKNTVFPFLVPTVPIIVGEPSMPKPVIAIINSSTVLKDSDITPIVQALQIQVTNHFAPAWGIDATLIQIKQGHTPPLGSWWMIITDDSSMAGALGFHDETPEGMPEGHVFAKTDMQNGNLWSVTISHELTELLLNPDINRLFDNQYR